MNLEITKLSAKELLTTLFDLTVVPFFISSSVYRTPMRKYLREREIEKADFYHKIHYLKSQGLIQKFTEGKEGYLELTEKGMKRLTKYRLNDIAIKKVDRWDRKWRVIIFDIPEKYRYRRDILRNKLQNFECIQVQKSVYVYPFPCTEEISTLCKILDINKYTTIMLAEIIQGENEIIGHFIEKGILNQHDLKTT